MPKRARFVQIPSPEIQGDDSWITVRRMSVDEQRAYQTSVRQVRAQHEASIQAHAAALGKTTDQLDEVETAAALGDEGVDQLMTFMCDAFSKHVENWNWVDDDDNPLPSPKNNPAVFRQLLGLEFKFIVQQVAHGGSDEEKKES